MFFQNSEILTVPANDNINFTTSINPFVGRSDSAYTISLNYITKQSPNQNYSSQYSEYMISMSTYNSELVLYNNGLGSDPGPPPTPPSEFVNTIVTSPVIFSITPSSNQSNNSVTELTITVFNPTSSEYSNYSFYYSIIAMNP